MLFYRFTQTVRLSAVLLLLGACFNLHAQSFTFSDIKSVVPDDPFIRASAYKTLDFDAAFFAAKTADIPLHTNPADSPVTIDFPLPDGSYETYRVAEYYMLEEALREQFPAVKTYLGRAVKNPTHSVRFDVTAFGLRAVLNRGKETVCIEPLSLQNPEKSQCFYKKDLAEAHETQCLTDGENNVVSEEDIAVAKAGDCTFRSYRLAVACTAEYANYFGATSSAQENLVLSAVVTSVNRVNEIFERDVAIRLILVSNNQLLFNYDPATDGYTNNDPGTLIDEVQPKVDAALGSAAYDVGHIFATGAGGVATLGSPCVNTHKARGVTGLPNPQGDPFDIEFVCHEIGHQFGANHTFNFDCFGQRNDDTAVEPGSGSTIMSYAGVCAPHNVQNSSEAFFHSVSLSEINAFVNGSGGNCATPIASGNTAPLAAAGLDYIIPHGTPFILQGTASDPDGDPATCSWEQLDTDLVNHPITSGAAGGPAFRAFLPVTENYRVFPNLPDVLANNSPAWEVLPTNDRVMTFQMTARDNALGTGGCTAEDEIFITTDAGTGPFLVTVPNTSSVTWTEGTSVSVTWDAANTRIAPVNCETVDLFLSYNGGTNFDTLLAENIFNDGSTTVNLPAGATSAARVMIKGSDNVFFDVSNQNFSIDPAAGNGFYLSVRNPESHTCRGTTTEYIVGTGAIGASNEPILLGLSGAPNGTSVSISPNPVPLGQTATVTVTDTQNAATGTYNMTLNGSTSASNKSQDLILQLSDAAAVPTAAAPTHFAENVILRPTFVWNAAAGADKYRLEVSENPNFTTTALSVLTTQTTHLPEADLASSTQYFWRVKSVTDCGESTPSGLRIFTTRECRTYTQDTVLSIVAGTYESVLNVADGGDILSLEVEQIRGAHTWVSDMNVDLVSPADISIDLWGNLCNSSDDFDLGFSDTAADPVGSASCSPLGGGRSYQPEGSLSSFAGSIQGDWKLRITDTYSEDDGELKIWSLRICIDNFAPGDVLPVDLIAFDAVAQDKRIELNWKTVLEENLAFFELERKAEYESDFTLLHRRPGRGSGRYAYSDAEVRPGVLYSYRLRMFDTDGSFAYSEVKNARLRGEKFTFTLQPNPTAGDLNIYLNGEENAAATGEIYDTGGRLLLKNVLQSGDNPVDISTLAAGIYFVKVRRAGFAQVQKLVVR